MKGHPHADGLSGEWGRPLGPHSQIVMMDVSNPEKPFVLSVVNLGPNSRPHEMDLTARG